VWWGRRDLWGTELVTGRGGGDLPIGSQAVRFARADRLSLSGFLADGLDAARAPGAVT
jgi:hypothetical protein